MARIETLRRYAVCSELAGDPAEASKAWRELATIRQRREEPVPLAEALRRQAAACEIRGERDLAFSARRRATEALLAVGHRDEAAAERLAMANHQRIAARFGEAVELAEAAVGDARESSGQTSRHGLSACSASPRPRAGTTRRAWTRSAPDSPWRSTTT